MDANPNDAPDINFVAAMLRGEQKNTFHRRHTNRGYRQSRQPRQQPTNKSPRRRPSAPPPAAAASSLPSNRSTSKALHCSVCDVWVPNKGDIWETHIAGLRHRREKLSLDIHGERGHVVVSQFENPDTAQRTAQRWQTGKEYTNNINNNSNRGHYIWQEEDSPGPSSISGNTGTILSNDLYTKLKALLYQTAGNPARYCEIEMVVARPLQEPSPLYMVKQDHEGQIFMRRLMKKIQVLADDRELHKHIVLDGDPINHKLNWIPFWAAVVCLYLDTLRSCRTVVDSIYIQFPSTPAVLAHPHRMQEVKIAYNVIFRHLKHLVEVHPAITSIHCIPPRILSISEYHHPPVGNYDDLFKLADAEHKTAIQEAAHRGAVDIRTAMLLGWHARAGEQSLLQLLPREAMAIILDYVAPLRELKFNTNI